MSRSVARRQGLHEHDAGAPNRLGEAWTALTQAVDEAPDALDDGRPRTQAELAEGYDYWAQVLTFALRREFHYGDKRHPMFHRIGLDTKIGFDNPDNVYEIAKIDPRRTYRVVGTRGTAQFIEFSVSVGFPGVVQAPRTVSKLDTTEIAIGADGAIELIVGPQQFPGNWLPTDDDSTSVLVRQVFGEWRDDDVPGDFRIVPLDGSDGDPSPIPAPGELADRLDAAATFVRTQTRYWIDYVEGLRSRIAPNTFETPGLQGKQLQNVNAARAFFCWGLFDLRRDQALIVDIAAPKPETYLGFHLVNYWLQSLDFVGRITSLNGRQAHIDGDGRIRYVLAHEDPGVPNWLDINGHPWGGMLFRSALTTVAAEPVTTVVPFTEIRANLPTDTPHIDAAARQNQIRTRRAHIASRFRW